MVCIPFATLCNIFYVIIYVKEISFFFQKSTKKMPRRMMKGRVLVVSNAYDLQAIPAIFVCHPGFRIRGTIVSFCADNKGAHELGGLMSPSCDRFCRICLIRNIDIRSHSNADNLELRTPENYDVGVRIAEHMNQGDSNTSLKRNCALNKSRFFNFLFILCLTQCTIFLRVLSPSF